MVRMLQLRQPLINLNDLQTQLRTEAGNFKVEISEISLLSFSFDRNYDNGGERDALFKHLFTKTYASLSKLYSSYAYILFSNNYLDEAIDQFKRSNCIMSDDKFDHRASCYQNMACCYSVLGQVDDAARTFEQGLRYKPDASFYADYINFLIVSNRINQESLESNVRLCLRAQNSSFVLYRKIEQNIIEDGLKALVEERNKITLSPHCLALYFKFIFYYNNNAANLDTLSLVTRDLNDKKQDDTHDEQLWQKTRSLLRQRQSEQPAIVSQANGPAAVIVNHSSIFTSAIQLNENNSGEDIDQRDARTADPSI